MNVAHLKHRRADDAIDVTAVFRMIEYRLKSYYYRDCPGYTDKR